jgi:hypothetical protein
MLRELKEKAAWEMNSLFLLLSNIGAILAIFSL